MSNSDIEEGNESQTNNRSDTRQWNNFTDKNELKLYKAALSNDWEKAKRLYRKARMEYGVRITSRGETALHIAALAGHVDFVENLVGEMKDKDIKIEMDKGNTAFHFAAISGNVKIAKAIMKDDLAMAMATGINNRLPIQMAASKGNKEMVRYLYGETSKTLLDPTFAVHCRDLLITLIHANIYDVALKLAIDLTKERREAEKIEEEALKELAQKPLSRPGFFGGRIYPFFSKHAKDKRLQYKSAIELVQVLWDSVTADKERVSALIDSRDENLVLEAAKQGNFEFLSILIASYPHVLFTSDHNRYTIFHQAILNRHVDIFKLINICSVKTIVTSFKDEQENNMLHLAGKLPPPNRLNIVPGAALQLQQELLWFEEVKKVMEPHEVTRKNSSINLQLHKMLQLYEKMEEMLDQHWFEELKKVMERYKDLESNNPPERLQQLFEEIKMVIEQPGLSSDDNQAQRKNTPHNLQQESASNDDQGQRKNTSRDLQQESASNDDQGQRKKTPRDLLLFLFKEVKNVTDTDEVTRKNSSKMLQLYQKMEETLDQHISNKNIESATKSLFKELMEVRERYKDLKIYNPPERLQQLFEDIKMVIEQRKNTRRDFLYRRILLFSKEMEKAMEQHELNQIHNLKEEHTPHEVFVKEHGDLLKEGEQWMRDTADSCSVVAALITTIAFAAAITVPGGNGGDGYPQFYSKLNFKVFAAADSVSLIFSATSLLSFLSILTSRYRMDDFRWSLPNKLVIGLLTLFISIAAMMVAFVLSIFIIFREAHGLLPILVAATSFVPIILFIWLHWRLFVDVIYTTYASRLLFKPRKDPYLLLKEQKRKRKSRFSLRAFCGMVGVRFCRSSR